MARFAKQAMSLGAIAVMLAMVPVSALASDVVPVAELLSDPATYQGTISLEGELVGDYGHRSDGFVWTQLNDDAYARHAVVDGGALMGPNRGVGVRIPDALAADLDPVGGYRLEGPLVLVTGEWKHHDPERGGESYLDVSSLAVIERGRRLEEGPDWPALVFGGVFLVIAATMWFSRRRRMGDR